MEYCENQTLRQLIDSGELVSSPDHVWRLFREVVEGLEHIHSKVSPIPIHHVFIPIPLCCSHRCMYNTHKLQMLILANFIPSFIQTLILANSIPSFIQTLILSNFMCSFIQTLILSNFMRSSIQTVQLEGYLHTFNPLYTGHDPQGPQAGQHIP